LDRGGIYAAIQPVVHGGKPCVRMDFGTELDWLASGPVETMILVNSLRDRINEWFGAMSYDVSTLPIKVKANFTKNVVESSLPMLAESLIANPEVFLAWADRMEEETRKLRQETVN
jgi:hypothetical protein